MSENCQVKSESTDVTDVPTALEKKIIRQIEYYFGDANLIRDKFLLEQIKKDDGWVKLDVLLTFNRLKALSEDKDVIVDALNKSDNDLLEINSDRSSIRRHPTKPLPQDNPDQRKAMEQKLLYAKGFPLECTIDDLIEFFDQYGGVSVQLRKNPKKQFKGSVFVLFDTAENAKAFLDAEEIKYKDEPLTKRLYKHKYFEQKQDEKMSVKQEEIKKKEEAKKKKEEEAREQLLSKITHGSVLKVSGIKQGTKLDVIKEFFGKFGKVAWVDFEKEDEHAMVRYATENEAKDAWTKAVESVDDGKVKLDENEITATVLEGEAEEEHFRKMFESINDRFNKKGNRGGGFNKRRGGHGHGPNAKRSKV